MNDEIYLIWSNEHNAWWAPEERGYIKHLNSAGRYSRERALTICRNTAIGSRDVNELPVRYCDVMEFLAGITIHADLLSPYMTKDTMAHFPSQFVNNPDVKRTKP